MVKIDLITGFLGSGKTTFIKRYVNYLLGQGEKICILENDYGAINIDMMLLSDLKELGVGLEMVAGGGDYDCHKRRFKTKLITMAMLGYTRVIVEPSGVFDVDEFFDILHESPLDERYAIGNVIAIASVNDCKKSSEVSEFLFASQISQSGIILLSHISEDVNLTDCENFINSTLEEIKCKRKFALGENIIAKDFDAFAEEDFKKIANAGYRESAFEKRFTMENNGFTALFFMEVAMSKEAILSQTRKLFETENIGNIIRVKGFVLENGKWFELNATKEKTDITEIAQGQNTLIVIGEELDEESICQFFDAKHSSAKL